MNRRALLTGLIAAPAVIRTPDLLMQVRSSVMKIVPGSWGPTILRPEWTLEWLTLLPTSEPISGGVMWNDRGAMKLSEYRT